MGFQFPSWGAAQTVLGLELGQAQVVVEVRFLPPAQQSTAVFLSKDLGFLFLSPSFY